MKKLSLSLFILFCICQSASALYNPSLTIKVIDADGKPVAGACTIMLWQDPATSPIMDDNRLYGKAEFYVEFFNSFPVVTANHPTSGGNTYIAVLPTRGYYWQGWGAGTTVVLYNNPSYLFLDRETTIEVVMSKQCPEVDCNSCCMPCPDPSEETCLALYPDALTKTVEIPIVSTKNECIANYPELAPREPEPPTQDNCNALYPCQQVISTEADALQAFPDLIKKEDCPECNDSWMDNLACFIGAMQ